MKTYEQSALTVMRSQKMFLTLMAPNTKLNHIRKLPLPKQVHNMGWIISTV